MLRLALRLTAAASTINHHLAFYILTSPVHRRTSISYPKWTGYCLLSKACPVYHERNAPRPRVFTARYDFQNLRLNPSPSGEAQRRIHAVQGRGRVLGCDPLFGIANMVEDYLHLPGRIAHPGYARLGWWEGDYPTKLHNILAK